MTLRARLMVLGLLISANTSILFGFGNLTIAINSIPSGGGTVTCTIGTTTGPCPAVFNTTTTIILKANPNSSWNFDNWGGACAGSAPSCTLTVGDNSKGVTANFSWPTITVVLTGDGTGGVVSRNDSLPAPIDCSTTGGGTNCVTRRPRIQQIDLSAGHYVGTGLLSAWTGCPAPDGLDCRFAMDKSIQVTAKFQKPKVTVTRQGSGAANGSAVTSTPAGINCGSVCSASFNANNFNVQLFATPASGDIVIFTGPNLTFGQSPSPVSCCPVLGPADLAFTATFRHPQLTVATTGTGTGSVVSNPAGINCGTACTGPYPINQGIDLTATPSANMAFSGYSLFFDSSPHPTPSTTCATNPVCHLVITNDEKVVAHFSNFVHLQLSVGGSGSIKGSISSGINCLKGSTSGCTAQFVNDGTNSIQLLTANVPAGVVFNGWTGDCSSSGTLLQCQLRMDKDHTAGANFTP